MDDLVADLLQKGAVRPIPTNQVTFISNLFLVNKKGSTKFRPVINLKQLNAFIPHDKFKLEGWGEVKAAIFPNCYFARIDLKDAFLSVEIHPNSQPYLTFSWRASLYCWTRLPFGLKTSPRIFTKLLKPVVATLRKEGILIIVYLDDFLLIGDSPQSLRSHVQRTTTLLTALGYTINREKSALDPSQRVTFLGYIIDSVNMRLSVPDEKLIHIRHDLPSLAHARTSTLRAMASLLGKLNALTTIVRSIRYYCLDLTQQVSTTTARTRNFDSSIQIPTSTQIDLLWWHANLKLLANGPITPPPVSMEITTDSSLEGWGAWSGPRSTGGKWNADDRHLHINALELKAILVATHNLAGHLSNTSIAIRTDNTSAMHCIYNFGSLRSATLGSLSRRLWAWAFERNIYIRATYIPGVQNELAEALSGTIIDNHSFSLQQSIFNRVEECFGPFEVDLLADFTNYEAHTYLSWVRDPFAHGIDAFSYR